MSDIFSGANTAKAVHDSIEQATAALPEGHNHAVLLDATFTQGDGPGVRALYVHRVDIGWTVVGQAAYTRDDGPSAGVAVRWSGK